MEKVLAIVGPTAVGKTALAIDLAQKFNGEIISGDSMQVYRHLDIGTPRLHRQNERLPQIVSRHGNLQWRSSWRCSS